MQSPLALGANTFDEGYWSDVMLASVPRAEMKEAMEIEVLTVLSIPIRAGTTAEGALYVV